MKIYLVTNTLYKEEPKAFYKREDAEKYQRAAREYTNTNMAVIEADGCTITMKETEYKKVAKYYEEKGLTTRIEKFYTDPRYIEEIELN